MDVIADNLGISWTEAWLTVVVATVMYALIILLSRVFGPRSFATSSSYDLAFVFALGSLIGRVILVRTSMAVAAVGLLTLFVLHRVTGWMHHSFTPVHDLMQNAPILVAVEGRILDEQLAPAQLSRAEIHQGVRLKGFGSLAEVRAVVLEPNGEFSVLGAGRDLHPDVYGEVRGSERLADPAP